jgi:hypothetical protein
METVWDIHGWDESFVGYGIVDWDYVERLQKAGLRLVNLTEDEGIWCLHQDHPRGIDYDQVARNDKLHEASKVNPDPHRNSGIWGNLADQDIDEEAHFSVVVPVSSSLYAKRLTNCLKSIRAQSYPQRNIDIVVGYIHDGRDDDPTPIATACRENDATLVFHRHEHEYFPLSLARNVLARYCVGRDLVIVDADVVLHPELLEVAAKHIDARQKVLGFHVVMMPGAPDAPCYSHFEADRFEKASRQGGVAPGTAGCLVVPWAIMARLRGYDERYIGYGYEDWDFTDRLEVAGYERINISRIERRITAMHQPHPSQHGSPAASKNQEIYARVKGRRPVRNLEGWGGLP